MQFTAEERHAARQLMYMHGSRQGYPPGSFHEHLIRAMMHADEQNLGALLRAFPEYEKPVYVLRYVGLDALEKKVASETSHE